jgi:hypothetical protein
MFLNRSRTLIADAHITNGSEHEITPALCGNVRVEREDTPGVFTDVTVQLECASIGLPGPAIRPHGELIFQLSVPVQLDAAPVAATYRVKFGVFVDGNRSSRPVSPRPVASEPFVVTREIVAERGNE